VNFSRLFSIVVLGVTLVACGGGGGGGGGGGVDTDSNTVAASCSSNPVLNSATTYFGVTPEGDVGTWKFDTSARTVDYQVGSSMVKADLISDVTSCSYTSSGAGALRTAFAKASPDVAVSAANIAGVNTAALLIASPETALINGAGIYNLMIVESERPTGGITSRTSTFATLQVDTVGAWSLCREMSYSSTCGGPTGNLTVNPGGGFDLQSGGDSLGRVFVKTAGLKKVMIVAFNDTTLPNTTVSGMWIGSTNDVWVPGSNDGVYVTNTNEQSSSLHTLTGLNLKPNARPTAVTLLANQPIQGVFEIVTGDTVAGVPVNDVGFVSSLGIYADVAKRNSTSSGFMRFGVKP